MKETYFEKEPIIVTKLLKKSMAQKWLDLLRMEGPVSYPKETLRMCSGDKMTIFTALFFNSKKFQSKASQVAQW